MKATFFLRLSVVLALMLLICEGQARAQGLGLPFSVTPSANSSLAGNPLTYTINLTNKAADLAHVFVTNSLSLNVVFTDSSSTFVQSGLSTSSNTAIFTLTNFPVNGGVALTLTVVPTEAGSLTNTVTVGTDSPNIIPVPTNVVTQVTFPQSDLSVALTGPANSVFISNTFFVDDLLNYSLSVSNAGPSSPSGVLLTNTLPPGVKLLSTSQTYTLTSNVMLFALGTMAGGSNQTIGLAIQPTNPGSFQLSASVGAPGFVDTNPTNNFATTSITVSNFLPSELVVTNLTNMMTYDPQTGLMKQRVRLSNVGTNAVPSARVIVSGLTNLVPNPVTNGLYNAVGTNNGNPYVVYATNLDAGQSVDLGLKYFIPTRQPNDVPNSNYTAVGVSAVNLSPPAGLGTGTNKFTQIVQLPTGGILIEFESIPGSNYTVVYSSSPSFTNAMIAPPPVVAPANHVQWIDEGPPETISPPANTLMRFYRVFSN